MDEPQFKIHGDERRTLKKELSFLKLIVKDFWYDHMMEKDMASFYGGSDSLMSDADAKVMDIKNKKKIEMLEQKLAVPYGI
jgi:hypothetical protein